MYEKGSRKEKYYYSRRHRSYAFVASNLEPLLVVGWQHCCRDTRSLVVQTSCSLYWAVRK